MSGLAEPMFYGRDVDDAHTFVLGLLGWMLDGRSEAARGDARDALRANLEDHLTSDGVTFASATWLISAHRLVAQRAHLEVKTCLRVSLMKLAKG